MKKEKIKIAVCGELGLDTPFPLPDEELCREYRSDQRSAFSSIIETVLSHGVDVAVFCGRLFDVDRLSERNLRMLCDAFSAVRSCRFVLFRDGSESGKIKNLYDTDCFSENVYIAGKNGVDFFEFDDIGVSVRCANGSPAASTVSFDHDKLNILCSSSVILRPDAACGVYDLIAMNDPSDGGIGRLGAIECVRAGRVVSRSGDPTSARLGGIYYIEAEKRGAYARIEGERIAFGRTVYADLEVSLDGCADESEALGAVRSAILSAGIPGDAVVSLTLRGRTRDVIGFSQGIVLPGIRRIFINNRTSPTIDSRYLERDMTARGQLYRSFHPMMQGSQDREVAEDALRIGFSALARHDGGAED